MVKRGAQKDKDNVLADFVQALERLERLLAPPVSDNSNLVRYIGQVRDVLAGPNWSASEVLEILRQGQPTELRKTGLDAAKDGEDLRHLSLAEAIEFVESDSATKESLLRIAQFRFQAQPGPLQRLSKEVLRTRVLSLARGERAHNSIARAASGAGAGILRDDPAPLRDGEAKESS